MNREQLECALCMYRTTHSVREVAEDVVNIQAGLLPLLGVLLAPEEAVVVWERFAVEHYATGWTSVDEGVLEECAQMLRDDYQRYLLHEGSMV